MYQLKVIVISGDEIESVEIKAREMGLTIQSVGNNTEKYLTGVIPEGDNLTKRFIRWLNEYPLVEWAIIEMAHDQRPKIINDSSAILQQ
ncbi:hypothetical protein [Deinococcus fonticola]|uniref:hypothetical protein n=1 Tax=Deinococcus fonticola TaxID=2528713 RepID=UPI0010756423|nr:hypothetical protein [Deinococcus fonticola]